MKKLERARTHIGCASQELTVTKNKASKQNNTNIAKDSKQVASISKVQAKEDMHKLGRTKRAFTPKAV